MTLRMIITSTVSAHVHCQSCSPLMGADLDDLNFVLKSFFFYLSTLKYQIALPVSEVHNIGNFGTMA